MKKFIFILIFLFFPFVCFGAMPPFESFCERQGYVYEFDKDVSKGYCFFNNEDKCLAYEFYNEDCGQEYLRELPCVKEGEHVFIKEECCIGEPYLPSSVTGQNKCKSLSLYEKLDKNIGLPKMIVSLFVFFIFIVVFVIYKKRKR